MKRLVFLVGGIVLFIAGFFGGYAITRQPPKQSTTDPVISAPREGLYSVARVLDGDTVELASGERVRFLGIDAPESGKKWSSQAYKMNRDLVEGKTVKLELDRITRDPYGRILAYVWIGGTMVNEALIGEGFARYCAVRGEVVPKYRDRLIVAEAEAKQGHRGIWMDAWESAP